MPMPTYPIVPWRICIIKAPKEAKARLSDASLPGDESAATYYGDLPAFGVLLGL